MVPHPQTQSFYAPQVIRPNFADYGFWNIGQSNRIYTSREAWQLFLAAISLRQSREMFRRMA